MVIVNETFLNRHRDSGPAPVIGRRLMINAPTVGPRARNLLVEFRPRQSNATPPPVAFEVVGVVKDIRNAPLGQPVEPTVYFSAKQFPYREMFLTVRATNVGTGVQAIRRALTAVSPNTPIGNVQTWGDRMAAQTAEQRVLMTLLVVFGAAAGLLAALGIYGLFSWSVALRTRELAIRLTLGARPVSVGIRVIRQSVVLIAAGLIIGLGIIWLAETALTRVLFDMSPRDPASLVAACALLVVVALVACVPPALRALARRSRGRPSRRVGLSVEADLQVRLTLEPVSGPSSSGAGRPVVPGAPSSPAAPNAAPAIGGVTQSLRASCSSGESPGVAAISHAGSSC